MVLYAPREGKHIPHVHANVNRAAAVPSVSSIRRQSQKVPSETAAGGGDQPSHQRAHHELWRHRVELMTHRPKLARAELSRHVTHI